MVDFSGIIKSSARIIKDVGREVFIQRNVSTTSTNVSKPWLGKTELTENHKVYGAFVNFTDEEIDGTLIKAGDQQCFISPDGLCIDITTTDKIIDGDTTWTVVKVKSQKPGDGVLIFNLQVRT